MPSDIRKAPAEATRETPATAFELIYAFGLVGAGLIAVAVLLYGLIGLAEGTGTVVWALVGLVAYLAVWLWGMWLAKNA